MTTNSDRLRENIRRYLDAGASLSKMSRRELEEMLGEFLHGAVPTREKLEDVVDEVRAAGRRSTGFIADLVRSEVRREVDAAAHRRRAELADLVDRASGMLGDFLGHGIHRHGAAHDHRPDHEAEPLQSEDELRTAAKGAAKKAAAKKAAAKKAPTAKKAAAKKPAAKKAAAKKAPAKKAAAKKAAAPERPDAE